MAEKRTKKPPKQTAREHDNKFEMDCRIWEQN